MGKDRLDWQGSLYGTTEPRTFNERPGRLSMSIFNFAKLYLGCPFAEAPMKRDLFFVECQTGRFDDPDEIAEILRRAKQRFLDCEPRSGPDTRYKTILVVFPEMAGEIDVLGRAHAALKLEFIDLCLMIGKFHAEPPPLPGLWNEVFRPFYSPVPLVAVRHRVAGDSPLLNMEDRFVHACLKYWSGSVPLRLHVQVEEFERSGIAVQVPRQGDLGRRADPRSPREFDADAPDQIRVEELEPEVAAGGGPTVASVAAFHL